MNFNSEDWQLLRNTVAEPVDEIIAAEVDTVARAREVITELTKIAPQRPHVAFEIDYLQDTAAQLLDRAQQATKDWSSENGLLFLIDTTSADSKDDAKAREFWQSMNFLRERWYALKGQKIFFLLPYSYRLLGSTADHLKRWIALKVHLLEENSAPAANPASDQFHLPGLPSPDVARQQVSVLEMRLKGALQRGTSEKEIVERYYLPMFEAAIALGQVSRAKHLRDKIKEDLVPEKALDHWLELNASLALNQFRLDDAKRFATRKLDLAEMRNNAEQVAATYHILGRIAEEQRNFGEAKNWFLKSLAIEKRGSTYHQLGVIAQVQRDFIEAKNWYLKSLAIKEKRCDEYGSAITYHQLGMLAQDQRDFAEAKNWYSKSLAIIEKQGNDCGSAITYHQLGLLAQDQRDFADAKSWYLKSLAIAEKQGNEHGAAMTYHQLGTLAASHDNRVDAGNWLIKSAQRFAATNDTFLADVSTKAFVSLLGDASPDEQRQLREMWKAANLPPVPDATEASKAATEH